MPINDPHDDRYPGDGWGGDEEGTRRIDEISFGPGSDDAEAGNDTGGRR